MNDFNTENKYSSKNILFTALFLLAVVVIFGTVDYLSGSHTKKQSEVASSEATQPAQVNPFDELHLGAKAAYVYDVVTGKVLYSYNEQKRLPLASLTKLMTALVATDLVPASTVVTVSPDDIATEGDSGLLVGERWTLRNMLDYTLITSSNDGASAIATVIGAKEEGGEETPRTVAKEDFVARMNQKSQEIGLIHTYFLNETGLDLDQTVSGAYGTAKETSELLAHLLETRPRVVEATSEASATITSLSEVEHSATNTNTIINELPGLMASKTGYTDLAGGNLTVAFDAGIMHPIIVTVLGSTAEGRFQDVAALVRATLKSLDIEHPEE